METADFDGMYTGCDYNVDTGLTYHWNRWRSEDGSAFISEDPARDGANWYGYACCNPMVYVDRIGLFAGNAYLGPGVEGPQPKTQNQENGFVPLVQNPNGTPQNITGPSGMPESVLPIPRSRKFKEQANTEKEISKLKNENFELALDYTVQTVNDIMNLFSIFGEAVNVAKQQSYDVYSFCFNFALNVDIQNLAESVSDYKNEDRLTQKKVDQIMQKK